MEKLKKRLSVPEDVITKASQISKQMLGYSGFSKVPTVPLHIAGGAASKLLVAAQAGNQEILDKCTAIINAYDVTNDCFPENFDHETGQYFE